MRGREGSIRKQGETRMIHTAERHLQLIPCNHPGTHAFDARIRLSSFELTSQLLQTLEKNNTVSLYPTSGIVTRSNGIRRSKSNKPTSHNPTTTRLFIELRQQWRATVKQSGTLGLSSFKLYFMPTEWLTPMKL